MIGRGYTLILLKHWEITITIGSGYVTVIALEGNKSYFARL
jgi:hypothetical protein